MTAEDKTEVARIVDARIGELIVWLNGLSQSAEIVDRPDVDSFKNALGLQNLSELPETGSVLR